MPAVLLGVEAFPVDAHARGDDQAPDRTPHERLQQDAGPGGIRCRVVGDFVHRLPHPDACCQVHHGVDPLQCAVHGSGVADVANLELYFRVEVVRPRLALVHLRNERIEHAHLVAGPQ